MADIDRRFPSQSHKLERFRETFQKLRHLPGDFAEFGVYNGQACRDLASLDPDRSVWAFDTFQGMPEAGYDPALDFGDPPGKWKPGTTTEELFDGCPTIIPIKGEFRETLVRKYSLNLVLVHIDCDWYSSHKLVLEFLETHMHPEGRMIFDDAYLPGARKAITEWVARVGSRAEFVRDDEAVWNG